MLVGIVGFINSGKTTVGDFLIKNHDFVSDSFAKSLKDAASVIFGWNREMLEGLTTEARFKREQTDRFWSEKLNRKNFTPRQGLQLLGTESGREVFGEALWTSGVEKRWIDGGKQNTVITDCRFPNEIKMIRDLDGCVLRVSRGADPEWYQQLLFFNKGMCDEDDIRMIAQQRVTNIIPHKSETEWIGCDFDENISNNGELEDLERNVAELADKLMNVEKIQYGLGIV